MTREEDRPKKYLMRRQILGKKDTSHHWGGLERKVTPEGHILWLCPEHAKEYK